MGSLERQESQEASDDGLSREQQHFYLALGKNKKKMKGLLGGGSGGETSTQGAATPSARSKHTMSRRKYLPSTSTTPPTAPHQRPSAAKTSSKAALPTTPGKGERHQQSVDSKEDAKEGKKEVSGRSGASGRPLAS